MVCSVVMECALVYDSSSLPPRLPPARRIFWWDVQKLGSVGFSESHHVRVSTRNDKGLYAHDVL